MENYEFPRSEKGDSGRPPANVSPARPGSAKPPIASTVRMAAPRPRGRGWMWFAFFLLMALGASVLLNLVLATATLGGGGGKVREVVLKDNQSENKIAMIEIGGIITSSGGQGSGKSMVDYIELMLERAAQDASVKAVLLKVDSPGGEALASDDIYRLIKDFQKEQSKPVVAVMMGLAASGGYYVSAPCRWIVANEMTETGSIGVIMRTYNYRGLMDKLGVEPLTFKSGDMKDMLSSTKPMSEITKEERAIVQASLDEVFVRFKAAVQEGRTFAEEMNGDDANSLAEDWEDYADGRLLSGKKAHELGFVDELGNRDTAEKRALKLAGISDANLVVYHRPAKLGGIVGLLGESEEKTVKIDVGLDFPKLRVGQLYFLPAILGY
jgi:protease-4